MSVLRGWFGHDCPIRDPDYSHIENFYQSFQELEWVNWVEEKEELE